MGAGLAGVSAAQALAAAGHQVTVFEKSRGIGGRTSTRRGPDGERYDHGAPFLDDGPASLGGEPGVVDHAVTLPDGTTEHRSVGEGAANAPAKAIAAGLDVRTSTRVGTIAAAGRGWTLARDDGASLGTFDAAVVAAPAPQTAELLRTVAPQLADEAASVAFAPCWAAMARWDEPLELGWSGVRDRDGVRWAVAEPRKPGRSPGERWVIQATARWTRQHLDLAPAQAAAELLEQFAGVADARLPAPVHLAAHRWLYAQPTEPLEVAFLQHGTLLAAGDWCGGATAGAALRSGRAAAAALIAELERAGPTGGQAGDDRGRGARR
ncbi:MAG: FAD-dependent oxidoreductase [Patulibacter minatonensis]